MTFILETEEGNRRATKFSDSINAIWSAATNGRNTPALLSYKTQKSGKFEHVNIVWSKESEKVERTAKAELKKMSDKDGVREGEAWNDAHWVGPSYGEFCQFDDEKHKALNNYHDAFDDAVKILRDAIARMETTIDPKFPAIGDLYFSLAWIYLDHKRYKEHDEAYEKGLNFLLDNLKEKPEYFGPEAAEKLVKLAHIYLNRDQLTLALNVYDRLRRARSSTPKAVAALMKEDWNLFGAFYEQQGNVDEAAACYRATAKQIDWKQDLKEHRWGAVRTAASSLIRLGKYADAERIYEQLLNWGLSKKRFKTEKEQCSHYKPCGHWFEPYFEMLIHQNRLKHRLQLLKKLGISESEYLPPPVEELIGYVDLDGLWKIPQRFTKAENFSDGFAEVLLTEEAQEIAASNTRKWIIDTTGALVRPSTNWCGADPLLPKGYKRDKPMHEGLAVVFKSSEKSPLYPMGSATTEYGYADDKGNIVIEPKFSEARNFHRGVAIVAVGGYVGAAGSDVIRLQNGIYGLIDRTGKYLLEPQFTRLGYYSEDTDDGLMTYEKEGVGGVISKTGEIKSALADCTDTTFKCSDGMAAVAWGAREPNDAIYGQKYGYLDATGKVFIEPTYENAWWFVDGLALVCRKDENGNDKYGYINTNGETVIDTTYDDAKQFKHGLAPVQINNLWGCISIDGAIVVKPIYDTIDWTRDDVLKVTTDNRLGLLDQTGTVLFPPQFDHIDFFVNESAIVTKQGLKGIIDKSGKIILEPRFRDLKHFSEGLALAATKTDDRNSLWGYVNGDGDFLTSESFDDAQPFSEGLAAVKPVNSRLWGYITTDGKFAMPPKFVSADPFCSGRARVAVSTESGGTLFGLIDTDGNYVLKPDYAYVAPKYCDRLCAVGKKRR